MPINIITLENFQSHKNTTLELSEGMNVVWGDTDHGKSSIIRGIKWVVLNRPQGDEFRRHETKKTQVTLETENFIVQRRRTNSKNEYEMDEDIFKALRSDVPEDISVALNLSEANIQSQHEVYFLIDKSPGQRSKILNEVAGLEIMDKVLKKTNSDIRLVNTKINTTNELLTDDQRKILELDWVNSADKFLTRLEKYVDEIREKENFYNSTSIIIKSIKDLENSKSEFISDECIKDLDELIKMETSIEELQSKINNINDIIINIKTLKEKCDSMPEIDTSELEKLQDSIDSLLVKRESIQSIIDEIKFKETQYNQFSEMVKETEEKIAEELKRLGKCPTCGAKI